MPLDFGSCDDVTDADIDEAVAPGGGAHEKVIALLNRMGAIATPNAGGWKVLRVLARAFQSNFVTGAMEVRLRADADWTVLDTFVDDGDEVLRLFPPIHLGVPLSELRAALHDTPALILPLTLAGEARSDTFRLRTPKKARPPRRGKAPSDVNITVKRDAGRDLSSINATRKVPAIVIPAAARRSRPPKG